MFHGDNQKNGVSIVEWVTKIKVAGDSIYGERYHVSEAPGSEYYFMLNTKNGDYRQFASHYMAQSSNPIIVSDLSHLEPFYYKSWEWVVPLTVFVFVLASGMVLLIVRNH